MATAILRLVDDAVDRDARVQQTAKRVDELGWAHQAEAYLAVVSKLAKPRRGKK
jgi:hypothetical protein